jgi:hypothetical protein
VARPTPFAGGLEQGWNICELLCFLSLLAGFGKGTSVFAGSVPQVEECRWPKLESTEGSSGAKMSTRFWGRASKWRDGIEGVDPANGDAYVADGYGNDRVVVFDKQGRCYGNPDGSGRNAVGLAEVAKLPAEIRPKVWVPQRPGRLSAAHRL